MSFLAPAFLAGFALLAVPLIVHLTQRHRTSTVKFPSLMFLERVPFKATDRRRIRDPLLFALRCLILLLAALAFARPALDRAGRSSESAEARDLVIVLDRSYSMTWEGRWESALRAARDALDEVVEGDRVGVVGFAESAETLVPLGSDLVAVRAALDTLRPSSRATRFDPAVQLAGRMLAESESPRREVRLITDFQRVGAADGGRARLPEGVVLTPVDLSDPDAANLAVSGIEFTPEPGGERTRAIARVANLGTDAVSGLEVTLDLGGRVLGTRNVDLPARGAANVSFEEIAVPDVRSRGEIRLTADRLPADDTFRFVVAPDESISVLIVESVRGRADRSLFLERALSIGDAPPIQVRRVRADRFDPSSLSDARVVILNDADLGGNLAGRLSAWVADGGGLVVLTGGASSPGSWPAAADSLLGVSVGGVVDRTGAGGARLAWLDYDHPVFEVFSTPRSGDFSSARFYRYRALEPDSAASVLARFEDGSPASVEHTLGDGRVVVWASTLDRLWNDLALQPVFLPFVHRLARHTGGFREPQRWFRAGHLLDVATLATPGQADSEWVLVRPDGARETFQPSDAADLRELAMAGFYEVRPVSSGAAVRTIAVNPPFEEADLTPVAPSSLTAVATAQAAPDPEAPAGVLMETETEEAGTEFWWPLLALAAVLLLLEGKLADRRRTGRSQRVLEEAA